MTLTSVDPSGFVADVLARRGALVEGAMGLLPDALARELGLAQEVVLTSDPLVSPPPAGERVAAPVSCALGSSLLEKLVAWARGTPRATRARLDVDPPRAAQCSSLASRFVVRNAVAELDRAFVSASAYAVLYVAWSAEADDRHAGVVRVVANLDDGSAPAGGFVDRICARAPSADLVDARASGDATLALSDATMRILTARTRAAAVPHAAPLIAATGKRHARDHARITGYFAALTAEARSPRRSHAPGAVAQKLAHFAAERDAKLHELEVRYAVRVCLEVAALVVVDVPVVEARLRVRRRKASGELAVRLPPFAQTLDELACAACGLPTARPVLCDERLHPLCESCVPSAQGRPDCAMCRRG